MNVVKRIALTLVIIGAINWGLIGLFQFDLVAALFGGQGTGLSRIVYTLVGISGILALGILFSPMQEDEGRSIQPGDVHYGTEFGEEKVFTDEDDEKRT